MSLTVSNDSKNNVTITNESKPGSSDTLGDHPETFGEQSGTFGAPGTYISSESKNNINISNESKN